MAPELSVMSTTEPLGLERGTVVLVPHDPRWSTLFARASDELHAALGSSILAVHHVGSTAVSGLCAKPILDVLVSIPAFDRGADLVPQLAALGYEFRPAEEVPDRHYFRRRNGTIRSHHLSLAEPKSRHHRVTLAFRDALRADPRLAQAYADLKMELAAQFPRDRPAYIEAKSGFIKGVLAKEGLD